MGLSTSAQPQLRCNAFIVPRDADLSFFSPSLFFPPFFGTRRSLRRRFRSPLPLSGPPRPNGEGGNLRRRALRSTRTRTARRRKRGEAGRSVVVGGGGGSSSSSSSSSASGESDQPSFDAERRCGAGTRARGRRGGLEPRTEIREVNSAEVEKREKRKSEERERELEANSKKKSWLSRALPALFFCLHFCSSYSPSPALLSFPQSHPLPARHRRRSPNRPTSSAECPPGAKKPLSAANRPRAPL